MACGCRNKNRRSSDAPVTQQQTQRVDRVIQPQERLAPRQGNYYQRISYFVFPDDVTWEHPTAELYYTLAEAQKRIRDLGPGYLVEGHRV